MSAALTSGINKIVICGTGLEYGNFSDPEPKAIDSPLHPESDYALSKVIAFHEIQKLVSSYKVELTYLRIFQAFGPGEKFPRLGPSILKAKVENTNLVLRRPDDVRDFVHVCDVAEQILTYSTFNSKTEVVNVSSGAPMSNLDFSLRVWEALRCSGKIQVDSNYGFSSKTYYLGEPDKLNGLQPIRSIYSFTPLDWKNSLNSCIREH